MHSKKKFNLIAVLALALAGMAIVVAQASAHGNRAARLDSDRDGASNLCETQASLDSTKTDTDGNGTIDGLEDSDGDGANNAAESRLRTNCGVANTRLRIGNATVVSYSAADGLALKIGKRGLITLPVASNVVCEQDDTTTDSSDGSTDSTGAVSSDDGDFQGGPGGRHGGPGGGGDRGGPGGGPGGDQGGQSGGDGQDTVACTTADLLADTDVLGAKVKNGKFTRIHLAAADGEDF